MPTIFTLIIRGELPGRFVWRDERCVAFLSINPLQTGHTLVVPIEEVDHWVDLDPELMAHLTTVAQAIAKVQQALYRPEKVALMIAGLEVPHVHLHVLPMRGVHDLDFANAETDPDAAGLDAAAQAIRDGLVAAGHPEAVVEPTH